LREDYELVLDNLKQGMIIVKGSHEEKKSTGLRHSAKAAPKERSFTVKFMNKMMKRLVGQNG